MYYDDYYYNEMEYAQYGEMEYVDYDTLEMVGDLGKYPKNPHHKGKMHTYRVVLRNGHRFIFDYTGLKNGYYMGYMLNAKRKWKPTKIKKERVVKMVKI